MAGRLAWIVQDATGNAVTGQTVQLYRKSGDVLISAFTEAGGGLYYVDHTISEAVYVKVAGSKVTSTDGMIFPADDAAKSTDLISTAAGKGASLIGVEDADTRFTGENLEAILDEIKSAAELLSTDSGKGAALVGIHDTGGFFAGATVEAALAELGAILDALDGLTATAAELNKLDGASATVTPANLNILVGGAASEASSLHRHTMQLLLGNILIGADSTNMDLILRSQYSALYGKGDVWLDVYQLGGSGKAYVRTRDADDNPTLHEIATSYLVGDANFVGSPIVGGIIGAGKITNAIKALAATTAQSMNQIGMTRRELYAAGTIAGSADTNAAADPVSTALWYEKGGTYKVKAWKPWQQLSTDRWLRCSFSANNETAGYNGRVKFECSTEIMELAVVSDVAAIFTFYIDLAKLPVSAKTDRTWKISLHGEGASGSTIFSDVMVWVEL